MKAEIILFQNGKAIMPAVAEGVKVDFTRKGTPGKMAFQLANDRETKIDCGAAVTLRVDGSMFFSGYVFDVKYTGRGDTQEVTVYDQLRYLKNKQTYIYENKTAADVLRMIAADFLLVTGTIDPTIYAIDSRVEDDQTLFDIIQNALDETLLNTGKLYVLYDDAGKLCLRDVELMRVKLLVDKNNAGDFNYQRSIDKATYNQVRIIVDDGNGGERGIYQAMDSANISKWGVLQLTEKVDSAQTAKDKAQQMLAYYNRETRTLNLKDVLGDTRVRAGSSICVNIDLGDTMIQNFLVAEQVQHIFRENEHLMELEMRGGIITG